MGCNGAKAGDAGMLLDTEGVDTAGLPTAGGSVGW